MGAHTGRSCSIRLCAPLLPPSGTVLGPKGWRQASAYYGPDPRQTLTVYRPQNRALSVVLILSGPQPTPADAALARRVNEQGMTAVVVGRRSSPVEAFPAYISDAARAVKWIVDHADALDISPQRIGVLGIDRGVTPP